MFEAQAIEAVTMQLVEPDKPTSQLKTKFKLESSWHMLRVEV